MNNGNTERAQDPYTARIGAGSLIMAFTVLLTVFSMGAWENFETQNAINWVSHTREVQAQLSRVLSTLQDAETGQRGYLLTRVIAYLEPYESADQKVGIVLKKLRSLSADNIRQQKLLDLMEPLISEKFAELGRTITLLKNEELDAALTLVKTNQGKIVMDEIRSIIMKMETEENELLTVRQEYAAWLTNVNIAVEAFGFVLIILMAFFVIRRINHSNTVRTKNEETLQKRTHELENANAELDAFAHSVSHDLRAPLRSLDGFSQALVEDYGDKFDGEALEHLNRISNASRRMGRMIDDILTLARATRQELQNQRVDLSTLVREILAEMCIREPNRSVTLEIEPNVAARGDPKLLQVVLENLLANAWKFTSIKETAKIEFGLYSKNGEPVYMVRDNGAGFDMAYVDKLFGIFQRLHPTAEFEGAGVGLATVARLIRRQGGRIWANGEVNRGASFYFTLAD